MLLMNRVALTRNITAKMGRTNRSVQKRQRCRWEVDRLRAIECTELELKFSGDLKDDILLQANPVPHLGVVPEERLETRIRHTRAELEINEHFVIKAQIRPRMEGASPLGHNWFVRVQILGPNEHSTC